MPEKAFDNPDLDRIHDDVFIESIDRKEKLIRHISSRTGINEAVVRDEQVLSDMLMQLAREENPIVGEVLQDVHIFLDEWAEEKAGKEAEMLRNKNSEKVDNSFYDRKKAKAYMDAHWKQYSPAYPSFQKGGGDCTNFVSQVLFAGGMPWADNGRGYTYSSNWYCKPGATNKDGDKRITLSWKVAASFKAHWQGRVEKHMMLSYAEILKNINSLSTETYVGDVVQFCYSSGIPYHTLIITGYNLDADYKVDDIVLASHTLDSNTRSLYRTVMKYPLDYKLRVYIIKDKE